MSELTKEEQETWERLNYVPSPAPNTFDFDVSSMYAAGMSKVFMVNRVDWKEGDNVTIKVLKSR